MATQYRRIISADSHVIEPVPPYRDSVYDPFWAAAQDLDFPIALHIITGRVPDPFHFHTSKEQGETISIVEVSRLALSDLKVEIDAVAAVT